MKISDNSESMLLQNDHNNVRLKLESKYDTGNLPILGNNLDDNTHLKKMRTLGTEEQKL